MSDVKFTPQDATNLIAIAQLAPLKNLGEAQNVSDLLQRFAAWANSSFKAALPVQAGTPPAPAVPQGPLSAGVPRPPELLPTSRTRRVPVKSRS